jgi:hypothetical protein
MAISVIGGSSSSNAEYRELIDVSVTNSPVLLKKTTAAGVYKFIAYPKTPASFSATVKFVNSSDEIFSTQSFQDYDSGSNVNYIELLVRTTQQASIIFIESTATCFVFVEKIEEPVQSSPLTILAYNSTQTVTVESAGSYILLGGGGGGGNATFNNEYASYNFNGAGGSGYMQKGTISPGSYALVIGQGGAAQTNGSASTFNGVTAAGGIGTSTKSGGAGGSGGASFGYSNNSGGINGGSGSNGGQGVPGVGSGVQLPWWKTPPTAASQGGGFYGGGGCGSGGSSNASPNTGGGGGGTRDVGNGGSGGSGVLLIAVGV